MTQWWLLEVLANTVISFAYLCITILITVPLIQLNQLKTNRLASATAAIFFSCSVGHGLHALQWLQPDQGGMGVSGGSMGTWWLAIWHTLTACVAVYYLTLRRFYGRLLSTAPLYHDLSEQQRLLDLEAFQAEVKARAAAEVDRDHYAAMLESINQNSQSMIYVKDLEGRYLMANATMLHSIKFAEADLIGRTDDVINADRAPAWQAADRRAREGAYRLEEVNDGPDGPRYFDSAKFPLFDGAGKMYAICGISQEITESKRANAALAEARDEALAATAAKSAFLATMSHEIRTPMNAVIGMTDLLLDTRLDEQQHEFLDTVRSSGDALLAVINDILDFSKIESGELRLVTESFNLRDEVEGCMDLVVAAATAKGLDLVCYVDESCPVRVVGDAAHLRQILINLLSNAVKFTATGEVLMTMTAAEQGAEHLMATISVTDSGIGISAGGVTKLFRSFSQVDASPTRAYGGTGLGLAISKRLAEAMGGDITVTSIPGEGSTFTVTVVLGRSDECTEDARLLGAAPALAGVSALIVDDNLTNLRILDLQLSNLQMNCTTASTGDEALTIAASPTTFDIAVLDMNMPDLDGVGLAEQLRRQPGLASTPMILLTSMGPRPPGSTEQFSSVLAKPVKSAVLRAALATALTGTLDVSDAAQSRRQALRRSSKPLRILLAEDNPVNQRVAELMLDKLGHAVTIVGTGVAAVEAVGQAVYDVILMDVQMPQMDGLEATRKIRSLLPAEHQPHIIAMTANAMLEDQEACSAAGMESYLTKPVRVQDLRAMLGRVSATMRTDSITDDSEHVVEPTPLGEQDQPREPAVDPTALRQLSDDLLDDDGSLVAELVGKFLDDGSSTMSALARAAANEQAPEVSRLAHGFASSSELLGAMPLTVLLRRAQSVARERPEEISSVARAVQSEYVRVAEALAPHVQRGRAGPGQSDQLG